METLLATIRRVTDENIARNQEPPTAGLQEIRAARPDLATEQIEEEAAELEEVGLIHVGRTINDYYYQLIQQNNEVQ